jgi:hypothetical protein
MAASQITSSTSADGKEISNVPASRNSAVDSLQRERIPLESIVNHSISASAHSPILVMRQNPSMATTTTSAARMENEAQSQLQLSSFVKAQKRGLFHSAIPVERLLKWTADSLRQPLTDMDKSVQSVALKCFRDLQRVMGDRLYCRKNRQKTSDSLEPKALDLQTIQRHLDYGIWEQQLRDELYLQVLKQITANPSARSTQRGWQVLSVYANAFPPSKQLIPVFLQALDALASSKELDESDREMVCANAMQGTDDQELLDKRIRLMRSYIRTKINKLAQTGPRGHLPSTE